MSSLRRSNRLQSVGGSFDQPTTDLENVSPVRNVVAAASGKPISPVLSSVKVKPFIDAINAKKALEKSQQEEPLMLLASDKVEQSHLSAQILLTQELAIAEEELLYVSEKNVIDSMKNVADALENTHLEEKETEEEEEEMPAFLVSVNSPVPASGATAAMVHVAPDVVHKQDRDEEAESEAVQLQAQEDYMAVMAEMNTLPTPASPAASISVSVPIPVDVDAILPAPRIPGNSSRASSARNLSAAMTAKLSATVQATALANRHIATVKNSRLSTRNSRDDSASTSTALKKAASVATATQLQSQSHTMRGGRGGGKVTQAAIVHVQPSKQHVAKEKMQTTQPNQSRHGFTPMVAKKSTAQIPIRPSSASVSSASSINSSSSIVSSRDSARVAKETATAERIAKVAELKNKWKNEHERKVINNKVNRETELNVLKTASNRAAEQRRLFLEKQRGYKDDEKAQHRQALQDKLADKKSQAEILLAQEQETRRKNSLLQQKDARKAAEADKKHQIARKNEQADILEMRRQNFLRLKEVKQAQENENKKVMALKTIQAMEQRDVTAQIMESEKTLENERLSVRRQNWEDDRSAKEKQRQIRRESLAERLDAWRTEKATDAAQLDKTHQKELEDLDQRHEDWRAVQSFKQEEIVSRRQSLAGRLDKWREEKKLLSVQAQQAEEARLLELELRHAEQEDVNSYRSQLENERRASLTARLDKARADADHEEGQKAMAMELDQESRRLAEQDLEDIRKNKAMVIAARRQSLEYRTQRAVQQQAVKKGEDAYAKEAQMQDNQLSLEAWRDVKDYQESCRAKKRLSLANKITESRRHQEAAMEKHRKALDAMHEDLENKRMDWLEIREYKKRDEQRSRKSILVRLDSWRQQRVAEAKHQTVLAARADEEGRMRELDREAVIKYQRELQLQQMHDTSVCGTFIH